MTHAQKVLLICCNRCLPPADCKPQDLEQLAPSLDPSQQAALRQALQNRNALIQGPTGTGKTFTGGLLCDLILKHSSETILCVCYTNHALDQFLESLLDKGINQIVRIGSRSKSKRLEQYSLRELAAKARGQTLNSAESRRFGALHAERRRGSAACAACRARLSSKAS
jgi:superfamily II DNA or RNA helicase